MIHKSKEYDNLYNFAEINIKWMDSISRLNTKADLGTLKDESEAISKKLKEFHGRDCILVDNLIAQKRLVDTIIKLVEIQL